jgi:hypothetical protein
MSEETTQQLPNDALKIILARFDSMDARHTALEEKVDRRLQETRPIWESVQAELKELKNDYKDFRRLFHSTFASLVRGQEDIVERLDKLEARDIPK